MTSGNFLFYWELFDVRGPIFPVMPLALPSRSISLYHRLWLAGIAMGVFVSTLIVGNAFLPPERAVRWNMLGYDFRALYIAGTFANEGRYADFYDLNAVGKWDERLAAENGLDLNQGIGPIFNPPFFSWMFAPLARWPYPTALKTWYAISFICLFAAMALMGKFLPAGPLLCPESCLILLLTITSLPAIQVIVHAQNTFVSLLMLTAVVACWRSRRPLAAGLAAGLLFYKPQLAAIVAIVLAMMMGRRALLGLMLTGTALLLLNVLTLPGTLSDFFFKMPANLRWLQEEHFYAWQRHATFRGFWRMLIQGRRSGPTLPIVQILSIFCMAVVAGGLARVLYLSRGARFGTDRVIAATITAMPLLMPFYFDYDLLLLAIPAVLTAADFRRAGRDLGQVADRWLPTAWVVLWFSTILNMPVAGATRFSPTVPAMCLVSGLTLLRAARRIGICEFREPAAPLDDIILSRCAA